PRLARSAATLQVENAPLKETGRFGWFARHSALAGTWASFSTAARYRDQLLTRLPPPNGQDLPREASALIASEPSFIADAHAYTEVALRGLKKILSERKIPGLVVLIPSREQVQDESRAGYGEKYGLREGEWDPNLPTQKVGALCAGLGLDIVDP